MSVFPYKVCREDIGITAVVLQDEALPSIHQPMQYKNGPALG